MREILVCVLLAAPAAVAADPLAEAELRLGYGLSISGAGDGMTSKRPTPLDITAIAAVAINEEPWVSAYGGATVETLDRNAVGATGGLRLTRGALRVAGGGTYIFAPYTLWGATGSIGGCRRGGLRLCGDFQLTAYFAGTDLAQGHTVTQVQGVLGVAFDAL